MITMTLCISLTYERLVMYSTHGDDGEFSLSINFSAYTIFFCTDWMSINPLYTNSTFIKAILRLFIYKALYDQSYLGSKTTMTTGWMVMLDFICMGSTYLFGTARRERKIQNENICLQWDSNPRLAMTRLVERRFGPLGYDTLIKIWRLMSYWIFR